jgi:hypothetical protein
LTIYVLKLFKSTNKILIRHVSQLKFSIRTIFFISETWQFFVRWIVSIVSFSVVSCLTVKMEDLFDPVLRNVTRINVLFYGQIIQAICKKCFCRQFICSMGGKLEGWGIFIDFCPNDKLQSNTEEMLFFMYDNCS